MSDEAPMGATETDDMLLDRLGAGDGRAMDVLFGRHHPVVLGYAVRLTGNRSLAEDVVQDTFVRLAERPPTARPSKLRAWLLTVARNRLQDLRRRQLLSFSRLQEMALVGSSRPRAVGPDGHLEALQSRSRLEEALARLPAAYREVVILLLVEGVPAAEAAEILRVRPEALRKRLSRARALLKCALLEAEHDR